MTVEEWGIVIGALISAVLALAPWMFMVHAKLAVIATQIVELGEKVEKAAEANQQLWSRYAQHEARLETHDVQFAHVAERLQEI
jgi:outer membrane murein-binding lipoprotein Lpp